MSEGVVWTAVKRKISELKDYDKNPRKLGKEEFAKLVESIQQDGYHMRLLINTDGTIIGGHARKKALLKAGYNKEDEIEVLIPDRFLEGDDFDRINIRDNLPYGSFDFDMLGNNFDAQQLIEWGMPADWLQFEVEEIEAEEGDNDVPELPVEPTTKIGDVWQLGEHRLMCGDSTSIDAIDKLLNGAAMDMVFTDPPYGVNFKYNSHNDKGGSEYNDFIREIWQNLKTLNCRMVITPGNVNLPLWLSLDDFKLACWVKKNAMSPGSMAHLNIFEILLCYGIKEKRATDLFEYSVKKQADTGGHPCPKLLELILDILKSWSTKDENILDLFGGSGSTLIACEKSKRKCFMMELDPKYCDVIIARWEKISGQKAALQ